MFKVRDLLIVAAVVLGVACGIYRHEIVSAARTDAAPVFWYVDAPEREALMAQNIEELSSSLRAESRARAADAAEFRRALEAHEQLLCSATSALAAAAEDRNQAVEELAAVKARYAQLCQRLLELGNDVPSVLAGE